MHTYSTFICYASYRNTCRENSEILGAVDKTFKIKRTYDQFIMFVVTLKCLNGRNGNCPGSQKLRGSGCGVGIVSRLLSMPTIVRFSFHIMTANLCLSDEWRIMMTAGLEFHQFCGGHGPIASLPWSWPCLSRCLALHKHGHALCKG